MHVRWGAWGAQDKRGTWGTWGARCMGCVGHIGCPDLGVTHGCPPTGGVSPLSPALWLPQLPAVGWELLVGAEGDAVAGAGCAPRPRGCRAGGHRQAVATRGVPPPGGSHPSPGTSRRPPARGWGVAGPRAGAAGGMDAIGGCITLGRGAAAWLYIGVCITLGVPVLYRGAVCGTRGVHGCMGGV